MKNSIRFECNHCASCCKNTLFSEDIELNFKIVKHILAERGLYCGISSNEVGIILFNDELKKLKEYAKKNNIDFHPFPLFFMIDEKAQNVIVLCWTLGHKVCPFLKKDNIYTCLVEDFKPLVCRAFPIIREIGKTPPAYLASKKCPSASNIEKTRNKIDFKTFYKKEITAAKEVDKRMRMLFNYIDELKKRNIIKPICTVDIDEANKLLNKHMETDSIYLIEDIK
jgi:Fe-S-cluster containining protein